MIGDYDPYIIYNELVKIINYIYIFRLSIDGILEWLIIWLHKIIQVLEFNLLR